MKITLYIVGGLLMLMGTTWFLQGANVLTAGTSPMIGDTHWEYYGAIAVVAGVALVATGVRKRR